MTPQTEALNCGFVVWDVHCMAGERQIRVPESRPVPSSFPELANERVSPCLVPRGVFSSSMLPVHVVTVSGWMQPQDTHLLDMLSQLGVLPEDLGFQCTQPWM